MTKPISPDEVGQARDKSFPDFVIEAFNECITKHWDGKTATFQQREVMAAILAKRPFETMTKSYVYEQRWLDVEDMYRRQGWHVEYDRPGYCETYEPTFTFEQTRGRGG